MTATTPPGPPSPVGTGPTGPGNRGMGSQEELAAMWAPAPPAKASPASRLLALGSIVLAAFAPLAIHGEVGWGTVLALSVSGGVALSFAAEGASERVYARLSGPVWAVLVLLVCSVVAGFVAWAGIDPPPHLLVVPPLVVLGFDWLRVGRLRVVLALGGVPVVAAIGQASSGHVVGLAWLVTTVVAFWMLANDEVDATPRPVPLGPPTGAAGARSVDLVGVIGLSLLAGLTLAFLFSRPSCSLPSPDLPLDRVAPPSEYRLDEGGGEGGGEAPGEFVMEIDGDGDRYVRDSRTGRRYPVENTPDGAVVRDRDGQVVAEIDGDGVVAHGGEGESIRYRRDIDGDLYLEGPGGERHRVERTPGGTVLRDEQGEVVASRENDGELVIVDPEGDVLVHDPDGNGTIPLPRDAVLDAMPGTSRDTTYSYEDGNVVATDGDGTTRTYGRDDDGRESIRVAEPGEDPRTFTYDEIDGVLIVFETDDDGNVVRTWRYDPDAEVVDGDLRFDEPSEPEVEEADEPSGGGGFFDGAMPWIVGALVLVALGATWWFLRRKPEDGPETGPERDWAQDLVRRLEAVGRERGRPRRKDETLMAYCTALADEVVFDRRVRDAGRTIDAGLFDRAEPSLSDRQEAEVVVAALEAYDPERPVGTPV